MKLPEKEPRFDKSALSPYNGEDKKIMTVRNHPVNKQNYGFIWEEFPCVLNVTGKVCNHLSFLLTFRLTCQERENLL